MASFSDPAVDTLMDQNFDSEKDPRYLYTGSQTEITKKLQEWLPRRIENNRLVMAAREKTHANMNLQYQWHLRPDSSPAPATIGEVLRRAEYIHDLDNNTYRESMRAKFLLDTLRHMGVAWPDLWYMPEVDGGVCSFLGTVDSSFDVRGTLIILEAKEHEERLLAKRAELVKRFGLDGSESEAIGMPRTNRIEDDKDEASPEKPNGNPKTRARAEQRKNAKTKVQQEKSTGDSSDGVKDSTSTRAETLARAKRALYNNNHYPGVAFLNGKIVGAGESRTDAEARIKRFVDSEFGVGTNIEELLGESISFPTTPNAKTEEHRSKDKANKGEAAPSLSPESRSPSPVPAFVYKPKRPGENIEQWMRRILPLGEQPTHPGVFFDGRNVVAAGSNQGQDKLKRFLADVMGPNGVR